MGDLAVNLMMSYNENVVMPDERFRIKSFISSTFEHVIAVHPHWHSEIEILYIIDGCAIQQVNEHFFTAETGDIIVIGRNQLHSTYSYQGSKCEILVIMFDTSNMLDRFVLQYHDGSIEIFENAVLIKNPLKSNDEKGKQLLDSIFEIHEELNNKKNGYQPIVKSLLYRIAGSIVRNGLYHIDRGHMKNLQYIKPILENTFKLIDEYYFEDISLKMAAKASNISIPHFCRLFKKATGMTFNTYLSFYRVNRAERMLLTHSTITSIAMECGFGSVSSFIRNFKKYKKCTPSAYKMSITSI